MSEVKKIATRETYGKTLVELGAEMPNLVVLDADLAGATKTGVFKKAYPDRHIDCGIAEGNMMSIAAGLAAAGMVPFASTFAMFAAGRAFEQVRNSIGYPHLNDPCRNLRRRGRRVAPVPGGPGADADDPGNGGHVPCR